MQQPFDLVGRNRERALLGQCLDRVGSGRGEIALIAGEGGIGKTALAGKVGDDATGRGFRVLTGRCYDLTETPPYGPWLDMLASVALLEATVSDDLARWAATGEIASPIALVTLLREYLAALAATQPLVLVFEDVHWADQESLDLLLAIARRVATMPVLIIATYRSDERGPSHPLPAILRAIVHDANPVRIHLPPLQGDDVWALVRPIYQLPGRDEGVLVAYLFRRGEGNPFFTRELLFTLEESGVLQAQGSRWTLGNLDAAPVPEMVEQVIGERVARLDPGARELLAIAAVIGQDVPIPLWRAVAGVDEREVLDVLDRASGARLLQMAPEGGIAQFAHALTRLAIYGMTPPGRRRDVHRRAAEALIADGGSRPEAVAHHLHGAGDPRAFAWWIQAGERAQRAFSWLTAADRFERALALIEDREGDATQRGWLLFRLALLRRYADPALGIERLDAARRLGEQGADRPLAAYARFFKGLLLCYQSKLREGIDAMESGLAEIRSLNEAEHARLDRIGRDLGVHPETVVGVLTLWLATTGRFAKARAHAERMLTMATPEASIGMLDGFNYADAYSALMRSYAAMEQPRRAREMFEHACSLFRSVEHDSQLARVLVSGITMVILPFYADDVSERRRLADLAEEAQERAGGIVQAKLPPGGPRLPVLHVDGEWDEVRALAGPFRAAAQSLAGFMGMTACVMGHVARCQGDRDLAWEMVREILPAGPAMEPGDTMFFYPQELQRLAVMLALDDGEVSTARAWLEAHDRWLAWSGTPYGQAAGQLLWAMVHRAVGDIEGASATALDAVELASSPRQPLVLLAAHRLVGELATAVGRFAEAEAALDQAMALADACAAPWEQALTMLSVAELQATVGRASAAAGHVERARQTFVRLRATPAIARADALIASFATTGQAEALVVVAGDGATTPLPLSPRELDVLRQLAAGSTNQEIADTLYLSVKTVESHITRILTKTNLRNRAAAAAYAQRHGLV